MITLEFSVRDMVNCHIDKEKARSFLHSTGFEEIPEGLVTVLCFPCSLFVENLLVPVDRYTVCTYVSVSGGQTDGVEVQSNSCFTNPLVQKLFYKV